MSNGKGSAPRPLSVSREEFGRRFDAVFAKKVARSKTKRHRELTWDDDPSSDQIRKDLANCVVCLTG